MLIDAVRSALLWPLVGVHVFIWLTLLGNLWYLRRRRQRATPSAYPRLSVCIPARNEADNLRRLLPSLLEQDYPGEFEILVWDDGSEDATWEVLRGTEDARLRAFQGDGPPPGWVGKVHALYQLTRQATGARYLFLDADADLADASALGRLVERFSTLPDDSVASGLPHYDGAALLLVSLVPSAILTGLPWPLVRPLRIQSLGALNGQCWMIDAQAYHTHEPHAHVRNEVLEDVEIGRYLKGAGLTPVLLDVRHEVTVYMYDSFGDAWRGFRKNAYLILGGSPAAFVGLYTFFALTWVLAPLISPYFLLSILSLKATTDRLGRLPVLLTLLAPVSYALGSALQADSAFHHWTNRVSWKGRRITSASDAPPAPGPSASTGAG